MKKMILITAFIFLSFLGAVFLYFFVGSAPPTKSIIWGVDFSKMHAQNLGLDWKETYLALLGDLGVRYIKIGVDWDLIEPQRDTLSFGDLDWQMQKAQQYQAKVTLAIGMKTPRWPECHIPSWAISLSKEEQQQEILAMEKIVVERYKNSPQLLLWQVENEPFFNFGTCPWQDDAFLKKEISLVRSLDPTHKILLTDSGEFSFWTKVAAYGDIVGTTMYRRVWFAPLARYFTYPFPPVFYWRKAQLIHWLFDKEVIGAELQAEPWGPGKLLYDTPVSEQMKTMNLSQFKKNIEYAKESGLSTHYVWGAEWWYWMKTKQDNSSFWNEAQKLFQN